MPQIPLTESAVIIRTDFSNATRWSDLKSAAEAPPEPFFPNLAFVDDIAFKEKSPEDIIGMLPQDYPHAFIILADSGAFRGEAFPCLVVDLSEEIGRSFRATACMLASIENNISLANMGFEEFADSVGADGVFRGF